MLKHFLFLLAVGCTQKYVDYDVIHKLQYQQKPNERVVAPVMAKGAPDQLSRCFDQWLFSSNAEAEKDKVLPQLIQVLCPGSEWLVDTRITNRWWTVILYSQACVEITTHCPRKR